MCGIAGIIGNQASEPHIKKMLETIRHRGPDDRGSFVQDSVSFGMTRLSIVDIAGGHQPMWFGDDIGIVFNGEIYNHKEIRNQLAGEFKTSSDTEVILKAYERYGIDFVHKLNGMFAIAIYDKRINKIFLLRDRLGIKPLYYGDIKNNFYFASEIKAIIKVLDQKPEMDMQALCHYLSIQCIPAPYTIWQPVKKLLPGHYLEYDLSSNKYKTKQYWSCRFHSEEEDRSRNYLEEFGSIFKSSVENRFTSSDVPVGTFLSGGIDSSIVSATIKELGYENFHTFSIGFEEDADGGELHYAREVADYIGSQHHEITISENMFLDFLPQYVESIDEPMADLACFPLYYIAKEARKHVKVILTGDAADEILAGYFLDKLYPNLNNYINNNSYMARWFKDEEVRKICRGDFYSTDSLIDGLYQSTPSTNNLDKWCTAHIGPWLCDDLLMKTDKMSMANSLEVRVPFLDHKLVEWAAKLPLSQKLGPDISTTKRILREYSKGRIPDSIIERPKRGFAVPLEVWMQRKSYQDWAIDSLNCPKLNEMLDLEYVNNTCLVNAFNGNKAASWQIWVLIVLQKWMERWV